MEVLGILFAAQMIMLLPILMWLDYKRTGELVTPWTIFLGMAVVDVFAPALLFLATGMPEPPNWRDPLDDEVLLAAMGVFTAAIVCFAVGYFFIASRAGRTRVRPSRPAGRSTVLKVRWAYLMLLVSGVWYLSTLAVDIATVGSVSLYLTSKLLVRWNPEAAEFTTLGELVFTRVGRAMLPAMLTIIGMLFFYRHRYQRTVLWGVVFPVLGWLCTLTTFFRGYQLAYCVSLVAVETIRLHSTRRRQRITVRSLLAGRYKKIIGLVGLGIVLFVAYGTMRNYYSSQVRDAVQLSTSESVLFEAERFTRGEGLIGLASIIAFYPRQGDYFYGKTLLDMTLLPVPRFIWESKPAWYGIDDITRRMGWPETTQNAVTMPGELYANFGVFGLPLMAVFGGMFGSFYAHRYNPRFRFLYAFVFLPCMLAVFWMSYTAFINSLKDVPVIWCTIALITRQRVRRPTAASSDRARDGTRAMQGPEALRLHAVKPHHDHSDVHGASGLCL